jgi:hypothetical protein
MIITIAATAASETIQTIRISHGKLSPVFGEQQLASGSLESNVNKQAIIDNNITLFPSCSL